MARQKPMSSKLMTLVIAVSLSHLAMANPNIGSDSSPGVAPNQKFPDGIINVPSFFNLAEATAFVDSVDSKGFVTAGYHYLNFECWPLTIASGHTLRSSFVDLADELFLIQRIHKKKLSIILNVDASTLPRSERAAIVDGIFALGVDVVVLNNFDKRQFETIFNTIEGNERRDALFHSSSKVILNNIEDSTVQNNGSVAIKRHGSEWKNSIKTFGQYFSKEYVIDDFPYDKRIQLSFNDNFSKKNGQLGVEEAKSLLALWSIAGFPIQLNTDVRSLNDIGTGVLANREIIAMRSNSSRASAKCIYNEGDMQVFVKSTSHGNEDDLAIVVLNLDTIANKFILPAELFNFSGAFMLTDLWEHKALGRFDAYVTLLPPHGCKVFKAVADRSNIPPSPIIKRI